MWYANRIWSEINAKIFHSIQWSANVNFTLLLDIYSQVQLQSSTIKTWEVTTHEVPVLLMEPMLWMKNTFGTRKWYPDLFIGAWPVDHHDDNNGDNSVVFKVTITVLQTIISVRMTWGVSGCIVDRFGRFGWSSCTIRQVVRSTPTTEFHRTRVKRCQWFTCYWPNWSPKRSLSNKLRRSKLIISGKISCSDY